MEKLQSIINVINDRLIVANQGYEIDFRALVAKVGMGLQEVLADMQKAEQKSQESES